LVGFNSGGVGTVTVSGAGSQWTNTSDLYVGYSGQGTLSILDGGKVSNTFGYVGTASGGVGTVTVSGVGSQWTNTGNLYVGDAGQGTLSITNGGLVSNTIGVIGNNSDGVGTVTVSGVGSQWKNSGDLYIGISGQGTLNITNGGQVSNLVGFVGYSTGGVGTMTVSGAGSQWTNDTEMYVGTSGQGTLNITNGGQVSNRSGHVGYLSGSVGTVTVSGSGSQWTNRGILFVGDAGQGTLNITNGGVVTVGGVTILNNGANSILNMNNGTLVTNTLAGSFGSTLSLTGINTLTIASNSTFIGNIIGTGGLNKTGNILLTLTGNNTHTGNSTVQAGTLRFNGGTNNAPFTVQNGAILRVGGGVTLNGNGQKLTALTGGQVIYEGAVNGSIALLGGGTHTINQAGLTFEAGNTTATSQVVQNASTTLNNSIIRGIWQSNADLAANGAVFTSTATVNVNSTATFTDVESAGTLNIPNGVTVTVGGSSPLVLAGGKTYVGSVANPGGTIDGAVDLNGGLLVNNGTITGMTTINFGAIAKGTGNYAGGYTITDRGQIIFGNSPGTLRSGSAVWEAGAQLIFQIDQATGVAGVNWGFNDITGSLTLASSSANAYTLLLESLVLGSGETLGQLSGFDHRRNYEWLWIRTLSSVSNFDADAFRFDVAGFAANNPLNGGMFSVVERDNSLWVQFTSSSSQSAAPEPTTFVLLGVGFIGVAGCRKRGI
jgi:T5SS/PEP-CTERM-associated repeat protein